MAGAKTRTVVGLSLKGGSAQRTDLCGKQRSATVADLNSKLAVLVRVRARPAKAKGTGAVTLTIDRCEAGHWVSPIVTKLGKGLGRYGGPLPTSTAGEYRLRARFAGSSRLAPVRGKAVYLRVGPATPPAPTGTVDVPVTFKVKNTNTSMVSCSSDGKAYDVKGHLAGPAAALAGASPTATLYLHGLAFGDFYWRFDKVAGYDYGAELAKAGHVTVTIDRIGYDSSGHPDGTMSCLGSQADVAHQVIGKLKSGDYTLGQPPSGGAAAPASPPKFVKVAIAGHSIGGAIAQIEAYSYTDSAALVVMAYADSGSSQTAQTETTKTGAACAGGGQPAEQGQPGGYAYFGQAPADFKAAMFHNADQPVIDATTAARNRDPCGDTNSVLPTIVTDQANLAGVKTPVLLVYGRNDALFPPPAGDQQKGLFTGAKDLTEVSLENTGHALNLERTAPMLRQQVGDWLGKRGF